MITKAEENSFTQKCICGKLYSHSYSEFSIVASFITLSQCSDCNSLEVLYNNNKDDEHSILVSKVFAKIATQGE